MSGSTQIPTARIIIEQIEGEWHAWFADVPKFTRAAPTPGEAVSSLLSLFTDIEFSLQEIAPVEADSTETHLEFVIPYLFVRTIPRSSLN